LAIKIGSEHQVAVIEFLKRVVLPILHEDAEGQVQQVGTGFLFAQEDALFLVTARHHFEELAHDAFAVPDDPLRGGLMRLSFDLLYPKDPEHQVIDIAVLKLRDIDVIKALRKAWTVLDETNTATASGGGAFLLCGYAAGRQTIGPHGVGGSFNAIYTERTAATPSQAKPPIDPALDIFLHYDREAEGFDGSMVKTPDLPGFSGSAIWEYSDVGGGLWSAARAIKVVGIQASWLDGQYARGKAWSYAQHIIASAA
jgi:hypothetical protein